MKSNIRKANATIISWVWGTFKFELANSTIGIPNTSFDTIEKLLLGIEQRK